MTRHHALDLLDQPLLRGPLALAHFLQRFARSILDNAETDAALDFRLDLFQFVKRGGISTDPRRGILRGHVLPQLGTAVQEDRHRRHILLVEEISGAEQRHDPLDPLHRRKRHTGALHQQFFGFGCLFPGFLDPGQLCHWLHLLDQRFAGIGYGVTFELCLDFVVLQHFLTCVMHDLILLFRYKKRQREPLRLLCLYL
ncbi:hypothetical protein D3C71_1302960 [compost metagenome]